jgi:hypothetical protein
MLIKLSARAVVSFAVQTLVVGQANNAYTPAGTCFFLAGTACGCLK